LLDELTARNVRWGIVTNKVARLTEPLVALLGLAEVASCVVSGDTTPHSKPHPAPLLHAAAELGVSPSHIVYVGDDARDVKAGKAAGMMTIAAAYGYCGTDSPPETWDADCVVESPDRLAQVLRGSV
jgi:phosphoglycolate phosphatase